jgi:hypothetical protein
MDKKWWERMHKEVAGFSGKKVSHGNHGYPWMELSNTAVGKNSGIGAILYAISQGANKVYLLGYDCKAAANGDRHWHGKHYYGLGNANALSKFKTQMERSLPLFGGATVVNCTRDTVLDCFQRVPLELIC